MKKTKKIAIILLLSFFVTTFQTAFPTLAVEANTTKTEVKENEENLTREEKVLRETVKNNPKYKKVRVPYINGVENSKNGLKISWDKVEGANYEVEVDGTDVKSVGSNQEFVLSDNLKVNKYVSFRVRANLNGENSNWSSYYGGFYRVDQPQTMARAAWVDTQNGIVNLDTGEMVERFREPDSYTTDLENKTVTLKKNNKGYKVIGSFRVYNLTIEPGATVYFESKSPLAVTGNLKIGDSSSKEKVNLIRNINNKVEEGSLPAWYEPMISVFKIEYKDSRNLNRTIENCNIVDKLTGANSQQTILVKDVALTLKDNNIISQAAQAFGATNNVTPSSDSIQSITAINNKIVTSTEGIVVKGAYVSPKSDNTPNTSILIDNNEVAADFKGITFAEVYNDPLVTEYKVQNNTLYGGDFTTKALEGLDLDSLSNISEKLSQALSEASKSSITNKDIYEKREGIKVDIKNCSYAICDIKNNTVNNFKAALVNTNGKLSYTDNKVFNAVEGIRTTVDEFYIGTVSNFFGTNEFTLNTNYSQNNDGNLVTPIAINNCGQGLLRINNATIKMNSKGIAVNNTGILEISGLSHILGCNGETKGAYNSNDSVGVLNCSSSAYALISRTYVHGFNVSVKNTNGDLIASGLDSRNTNYPVIAIAAKEGFREDSTVTIMQSNLIKYSGGKGVNIVNEGFRLVDAYVIYFEKMDETEIDEAGKFIYPKKVNSVNDGITRSCYVANGGEVTIDTVIYDHEIDITEADNLIDLTDQIPNYGLYRGFGNEGNDPATGNYGKSVEDFNSVFKYFDYNLSRTYNSLDERTPGVLGKGWRFSFQGSIDDLTIKDEKTKEDATVKQVTLPNGSIVTFKEKVDKDKNITYEALDSRNTFAKNGDGYVLTTKEKIRYYFSNNLLNQIADKNGNTLNIEYNSDKTIKRIIDMRGSELSFNYSSGKIESIVEKVNDEVIKSTKYKVEEKNGSLLLTQFTNSYEKKFYYDYDSNNQLIAIRTDNETLEEVKYDKDKKVEYHIDVNGNKMSYEYDTGNRQTVITDSKGFKTIERYDRNNQETFTSYSDGTTVVTNYQLDEGKNKYGEIKSQKDRNGLLKSYERDKRGNITKELVNSKVVKEYSYDDKDNRLLEKEYLDDSNKLRTFYEYDSKGNVVKEITPRTFDAPDYTSSQNIANYIVKSYAYEDKAKAKGVLKTETDAKGSINYTYDERGNIQTEIDHYGAKTSYIYNKLDLIAQETKASGNKVKSYYDNNGNLIKKVVEVDPFKGVSGKTSIADVVERYEYDNEGNKIKEIYGDLYDSSKDSINDINKIYTDDSYSGDANIVNTYYKSNKIKTETRKVSNKENYVSSFKYDVYGNVTEETKPNGAIFTYINDEQGRILESYIKENGKNVLIEKTDYQYTGDGGYVKTFKKYIDSNNTIDTKTTYNYLDKEIEVVNAEGAVNKVEYDRKGNVIKELDPRGYETVYKYNTQSKVESIHKLEDITKLQDGSERKYYQPTYYKYDDLGEVIETRIAEYSTSSLEEGQYDSYYTEKYIRKYDTSTKQETVITQYGTQNSKGVFVQDKSSGKKEIFDYNGNKVKEELTYEEGKVKTIEYVNTLDGKVREKIEKVLESDLMDKGLSSKEVNLSTSYLYDARGQVIEVESSSNESYKGMKIKYEYDYQGRQINTTTIDNANELQSISSSRTYNIYNDVLTSSDGNKNTVTNEYDLRGRLTKVVATKVDGTKETTSYEYDNADRLIREVAPENFVEGKPLNSLSRTEYVRDKLGRVLAEVQIGKTNSADISNKKIDYRNKTVVTKAYVYDASGNVIKEVTGNNLPEVTTADNYLSSVDDLKAKIKTVAGKEITYDGLNRVITWVSAENVDNIYAQKYNDKPYDEKNDYDGRGRIIRTCKGDGTTLKYYYDIFGNPTIVRSEEKNGSGILLQQNKYDGLSRLIESKDADDYVRKFEYNNFDKLRSETYDVERGVTETKTYIYGPVGNLLKWKNTEGQFEENIYDNFGRYKEVRKGNSEGVVTVNKVNEMDSNGNILSMEDAEKNVTTTKFDEKNRPTTVTRKIEDGVNQVTNYNYDSRNNILLEEKIISKTNHTVSVTKNQSKYDDFGKLIRERNSNDDILREIAYSTGDQPTLVVENSTNIKTLEYDKDNRLITEIDGEGDKKCYTYTTSDSKLESVYLGNRRDIQYEYDARGNLIKVDERGGSIDGTGRTYSIRKTRYAYDGRGNVVTQAEGVTDLSPNPNIIQYNAEKTTKYNYNGLNQITGKFYDDNSKEWYHYNTDGTLKETGDKMGSVTSYSYDVLGNVTNRKVTNRDKQVVDNIDYINDNLGNVKEVVNKLSGNLKEVEKTYDSLGRVISEKTTDKESKDNNSISKLYDIVVFDKVKYKDAVVAEKTTTSNNTMISKAYDKSGRLKYVVDGDIKDANAKIIGTYNYANNKISSLTYGDNSKIEYSYYRDNNINSIINKDSSNNVLESYKYTYDNAENPKTLTKEQNGVKEVEKYSYDQLNRLYQLEEEAQNGSEITKKKTEFKYNQLNDIVQTTENRFGNNGYEPVYETNYEYTNHRMTKQVNNSLVDNTSLETQFIYDANGNLCTSKNSNETKTYGYDSLNRLISSNIDGNLVKYGYNGLDKKVSKTVGSNITSLIYEGNNVIQEVLNNKVNGTTYYGEKAVYRNDVQANTGYYYFYNTHNDVTNLRLNGQTKTSYKYDAFGKEVAINGNNAVKVNNPIRYAGYYYEEDSNLYYLNARMYNPDTKRFMQQDTVIGDFKDPNTLNQYAYAGDNPITNYDPSGNFFETLLDVVSLGMSAYDFIKEPSLVNFGMLAWDVVSLVPGIPGSYVAKGIKYADRIDDSIDGIKAVNKLDNVYDTANAYKKGHKLQNAYESGRNGINALEGVGDIAKNADHYRDLSKAAKGGKEVLQETAERLMKNGDDLISDGRVIATSAKKAKQQAKVAMAKVQSKLSVVKGKISSVKNNISSSIKTKLDKVKALGGSKIDSVKSNLSSRVAKTKESEGLLCKAKTFVSNNPSCFTSDTLIKTEEGLKAIGELKVGDKVYSVDEDNVEEKASLKEITQVIESETDTLVNLIIDGEKVQTTKTHPFYVEGKGFTDAEYIVVGDKVRTAEGEIKEVEAKEVETLESPITVYNLEIDEFRTYFVGVNEVLVHNVCQKRRYNNYKNLREQGLSASEAHNYMKQAGNITNSQAKGQLGEDLMKDIMTKEGYDMLPSKVGSNNGFDGLFVKYGKDGKINDVVIGEAKFGRSRLGNTSMGKQMGTRWINGNIQKMIDSKDLATAQAGKAVSEFIGNGNSYSREIFKLKKTGYFSRKILK